jgi:diamine N-acetyltransferase
MADLRLEELSARTAAAANGLTLRRGQEQYVTPPTYAIADAYVDPVTSWPRVVLDGDEVVGFIRGNFDPSNSEEEFRSCVWRVNVAADAQGKGVGTFAVLALADEARSRGFDRITAVWEPGDDGPDQFFRSVGFEVTSETQYGECFGVLTLT